jgi:4-amino-4-deoxy-L-arabinose transferase-like glycosyltransferase
VTGARSAGLLAVATALGLLPFVGKAFHMDDPQFLWTARQILVRPADFYGFAINWYGVETTMAEIVSNPPLAAYYMTPVVAVAGFREVPLHLAFLLPAVAAVLGTWEVARRLSPRPALAAAITAATPVFVVSATTVMADVILLAAWVWAVALWMRGVDDDRPLACAAAVVLVAVAALTKYYGAALIPLLGAYSLHRARRPTAALAWFALPMVILAAYDLYTLALYERGLLFESAALSGGSRAVAARSTLARATIGLAFTGGCLATAALYATGLWSWRRLAAALPLAAMGALAAAASTDLLDGFPWLLRAGVPWSVLAHLALFGLGGVLLLVLAAVDLARHRDPPALLLGLWMAGGFVFAAFVNSAVNARSVLLMAPAAAILVVRRLGPAPPSAGVVADWRMWRALPVGLALALLLASADHGLAGAGRTAARRIHADYGGGATRTLWFQGHWGFQYYMELEGARAVDRSRPRVTAGDLLIIPENNSNTFALPSVPLTHVGVLELVSSRWMTTTHPLRGAGFYSDFIGPLPFAAGPVPPERYRVVRIGRPPRAWPASR